MAFVGKNKVVGNGCNVRIIYRAIEESRCLQGWRVATMGAKYKQWGDVTSWRKVRGPAPTLVLKLSVIAFSAGRYKWKT